MPFDLHLSVLVSEHGDQGQAHWLLVMFEVKGNQHCCRRRIPGGGSNCSRAMVHTRLARGMRKAERRAAP